MRGQKNSFSLFRHKPFHAEYGMTADRTITKIHNTSPDAYLSKDKSEKPRTYPPHKRSAIQQYFRTLLTFAGKYYPASEELPLSAYRFFIQTSPPYKPNCLYQDNGLHTDKLSLNKTVK